jgi:hypothetical protein
MNNRRIIFIALMFLAVIVACVVPGLPTASAPDPAPIVDTGRLATMVAETVSAAIAQTELSVPSPTLIPPSSSTSTSTSTPTSTITSDSTLTSTFTSAPTETPTAASTVTQTLQPNPSQSTLTKQNDGSTLFADERAGYTVKLPVGWLVVRINGQEYQNSFSLGEASNMNIQQALLGVKDADPNVFRLLAIDTQAAHIQNEFVSDIRFILDEKKSISLNSDADLQTIARDIPASATVFRFEVTSVKIITSVSGTQLGVIEARSSFANAAGADVIIYQKQVFFKVKAGTQTIIFTTLADLKGTLLPVFDAMFETVKVVGN